MTDGASPAPGDLVDGKFKLLALLGSGAMGSVFKAEQLLIERHVAVKFLHRHLSSDEASLARFRREAQLACKLRHPNAVLVFDFGVWKGQPYLVMELAEGTSLRELLQTGVKLSPVDARTLLENVGGALREAHSLGIVHRDLKPENISVTKDTAGKLSFRVLDFGLAKSNTLAPVAPAGATRYGMFFGTPAYASPEQAVAKDAGPPSDIYSLGIVVYEALTGMPPFHGGSDVELLMKHVKDPLPVPLGHAKLPGLSPQLAALIDKCLEKDSTHRFQDAGALLTALNAIDASKPAVHPPHFDPRHAILGALVIGLALFGAWTLLPDREKDQTRMVDPTPTVAMTSVPDAARTSPPSRTQAAVASPEIPAEATKSTFNFWDAAVPTVTATPPANVTIEPLPTYPYLLPTPSTARQGPPPVEVTRDLDRGMEYFSAGKYSDAIRTLRGVVQADPSQVSAWTTIGLSYEHLRYCREAQPALQQAIALDSRQAILYFYLSRVQAQCRQTSDSLAALRAAIQLDPSLRSRAASDALFATIARRPEFRSLIGATGRSVSRFDNFVNRVERSISNLWN